MNTYIDENKTSILRLSIVARLTTHPTFTIPSSLLLAEFIFYEIQFSLKVKAQPVIQNDSLGICKYKMLYKLFIYAFIHIMIEMSLKYLSIFI